MEQYCVHYVPVLYDKAETKFTVEHVLTRLSFLFLGSIGFFGMGIRSCIISLLPGWFMGFLMTNMESSSLAGNYKWCTFFFKFLMTWI